MNPDQPVKINVSHGEITLKPLDRKRKKTISKILFRGAGMDIITGEIDKVPMENMVDIATEAFEVLCDIVLIDGKNYTFKDLQNLSDEGKFTDEDWDTCEQAALKTYQAKDVKKKTS